MDGFASVSGGLQSHAIAIFSSVGGGKLNVAEGELGAIFGGYSNKVLSTGGYSAILGGSENQVSKEDASVSGGRKNTASGKYSSLLGGKEIVESGEYGVSP
jgi:hypothetical protein